MLIYPKTKLRCHIDLPSEDKADYITDRNYFTALTGRRRRLYTCADDSHSDPPTHTKSATFAGTYRLSRATAAHAAVTAGSKPSSIARDYIAFNAINIAAQARIIGKVVSNYGEG
jgi:hypothetical protein